MIKLEVTGKCKGCPAIELNLEGLRFESFAEGGYGYSVVCENEALCDLIERRLKREKIDG